MTKKAKKRISALLLSCLFLSVILTGSHGSLGMHALGTPTHRASTQVLAVPTALSGVTPVAFPSVRSHPSSLSASSAAGSGITDYSGLRVHVGGMPFGVKFTTEGVLVVGFCDADGNRKPDAPSFSAGLRLHDMIVKVNGEAVGDAETLSQTVEQSGGKALRITYVRDGKTYQTSLRPLRSRQDGKYKTGLLVRDSGAGIGTVTFILPESLAFGGLGHGISDAETGQLIPIQRGSVVGVNINGVVKGLVGTPGEVKGYFSSGKLGTLLCNDECGVFGVYASLPQNVSKQTTPIGLRSELKEGKAHILCTLNGTQAQQYEVEISAINRNATGNKCFTVKVTDEDLLALSGGIVQGMSGSPIIQNGKLVGAVTHVLINDPTTGYGIFIENMLGQMGDLAS